MDDLPDSKLRGVIAEVRTNSHHSDGVLPLPAAEGLCLLRERPCDPE